MKSLVLALLLCGATSVTLSAQDKLNARGRLLIQEFRQKREKSLLNVVAEPRVSAVVLLQEGLSSEGLFDGLDIEVRSELAGVLVVSCPITVCEIIAEMPEVVSVGFGEKMTPLMDLARADCGVDELHAGVDVNGAVMSYDGSGVVVGMMDTGLDAHHLNFKNPDGSTRIKRVWHSGGTSGAFQTYTPDNLDKFKTDDEAGTHATHVAGIMCGSYKGNADFASSSGGILLGEPIPFYGVATGADLAFSVGTLYESTIVQGVTNVLEYAVENGMPAVVNLSLGSYIGPHDGTDYYTHSLNRLARYGVICVAAGNEGATNATMTKTLGAEGDDAYLRTLPVSLNQYGNPNYGKVEDATVDLWSDSDEKFIVKWKAYRDNISEAVTLLDNTADAVSFTTDSDPRFSEYFRGNIQMYSSLDNSNKRFHVVSYVSSSRLDAKPGYNLMLEVSGKAGTKIYLFGSSAVFEDHADWNGSESAALSKGNPDNSISVAACGDDLISVGAYTTRTDWTYLSGVKGSLQYAKGEIAPFSSYGTTFSGRQMPSVCAPGAQIISSYSSYAVRANSSLSARAADSSGKYSYWAPLMGTSMACPYVTGVVALWLQACPTLTSRQVIDVIENSSDFEENMDATRWGAGKINAVKGLKYILSKYSSIGSVWDDDSKRFVVEERAGGYDVLLAGEPRFTVKLIDLQGRTVAVSEGRDGEGFIDASSLTRGIYVLAVEGASTTVSRKVLRN